MHIYYTYIISKLYIYISIYTLYICIYIYMCVCIYNLRKGFHVPKICKMKKSCPLGNKYLTLRFIYRADI